MLELGELVVVPVREPDLGSVGDRVGNAQPGRELVPRRCVHDRRVVEGAIEPGHAFHNANSVRFEGPFRRGFYYEVVVETDSPAVLPSVMEWSDRGGTAVAGSLVSPGDFVAID